MTEIIIPSTLSNDNCETTILNAINGVINSILPISCLLDSDIFDEIIDSAFDASEIDKIIDFILRYLMLNHSNRESELRQLAYALMRHADRNRDI